MKKTITGILLLLICALVPSMAFTEDETTVRLARTIYALAGQESYETKLDIGSVAANRAKNPWFPATLSEVLAEQHQFPCGSRYDADSLRAAHAILSGQRSLPASVLYYHALDAIEPWGEAHLYTTSGGYGFYTQAEN